MNAQEPSLTGSPRRPAGFTPTVEATNRGATIERHTNATHTSLEADVLRRDHTSHPSSKSHPHFDQAQKSVHDQAPPFALGESGALSRAPIQDQVENVHSAAPPQLKNQKPKIFLEHIAIKHSLAVQIRIDALPPREQLTVTCDGGNTLPSQLRVLEAIERLPPIQDNARLWTELVCTTTNKKKEIVLTCSQCINQENNYQKARQHFISKHVSHKDVGWWCPYPDCLPSRRHKRLDDLKRHHMVPVHDTMYYKRSRGSVRSTTIISLEQKESVPTPSNLQYDIPTSFHNSESFSTQVIATETSRSEREAPSGFRSIDPKASISVMSQQPNGTKIRNSRLKASSGPSTARPSRPKRKNNPSDGFSGPSGLNIAFGNPPDHSGTLASNLVDYADATLVPFQYHWPNHSSTPHQYTPITSSYPPPLVSNILSYDRNGNTCQDVANTYGSRPSDFIHPRFQSNTRSVGLQNDSEGYPPRMRKRDGQPGHDPPEPSSYVEQGGHGFRLGQTNVVGGSTPNASFNFGQRHNIVQPMQHGPQSVLQGEVGNRLYRHSASFADSGSPLADHYAAGPSRQSPQSWPPFSFEEQDRHFS